MPQILIDTDAMTAAEIGATVNFLDDLLTIRRAKDDKAPAPSVNETAPPPPPAAPLTVSDVVSDNDPEVEIDSDGSVQSVTVSATAAPPPPPVPAAAELYPHGPMSAERLPPAAPVPPGPAATPEYDAKGAPWDGRIHASNRAKKIDGTWKNKRGVSADLITACEAQNKPGNAPSTATGPAAAVSAPAASASIPVPPPPAVPPAPAVPSAVTSSAVPSTGAVTTIDFRGLMQKIQSATAANKLTAEQVNAALAGVGLKPEEMAQLINNAPLIASLNAAVEACLTS